MRNSNDPYGLTDERETNTGKSSNDDFLLLKGDNVHYMYLRRDDPVYIFTKDGNKVEAKITDVFNSHIEYEVSGKQYVTSWEDITNIFPMPHRDPSHMFDKYDLTPGDRIDLKFITINGDHCQRIGTVKNVNKSVIIIDNGYEGVPNLEVLAPFNLISVKILRHSPLRAKKYMEEVGE